MAVTARNAADAVIDDATSPEPNTAYGRSKREAELAVADIAGSACLSISLRPPMIIGADAKGNWARLQALAASQLPLPALPRSVLPRSLIGVEFPREPHCPARPGSHGPPRFRANYGIASADPLALPEMLQELAARHGGAAAPCRLSARSAARRRLGRRAAAAKVAEPDLGAAARSVALLFDLRGFWRALRSRRPSDSPAPAILSCGGTGLRPRPSHDDRDVTTLKLSNDAGKRDNGAEAAARYRPGAIAAAFRRRCSSSFWASLSRSSPRRVRRFSAKSRIGRHERPFTCLKAQDDASRARSTHTEPRSRDVDGDRNRQVPARQQVR